MELNKIWPVVQVVGLAIIAIAIYMMVWNEGFNAGSECCFAQCVRGGCTDEGFANAVTVADWADKNEIVIKNQHDFSVAHQAYMKAHNLTKFWACVPWWAWGNG